MKKRYLFLILLLPLLLCISSLLWYRSKPKPEPTATLRPTPEVSPTVPAAKVASRWPSWSPDGNKIAYVLIENKIPSIAVQDLETQESISIFSDAYEIDNLGWSPLGDRIAFNARSSEEDPYQIYTIRPDGSELSLVSQDDQGWIFLQWTQDGNKIVFRVTNIDDNHSLIFMINPDGTEKELLTKAVFLTNVSFSSLRNQLIFTTEGGTAINIKDFETGVDSSFSEGEDVFYSWPMWSPDGNWIAYTAHARLRGEIHLLNPINQTTLELTNMSQEDKMLAWSPDSKTIAFQRTKPPELSIGDIFLIDVDGNNLRQLTDTPFDEFECLWSPQGDKLAITLSDPMPPFWDVYIINIDGSGMYRLRDNMPYP